jgi:hypothetical protein
MWRIVILSIFAVRMFIFIHELLAFGERQLELANGLHDQISLGTMGRLCRHSNLKEKAVLQPGRGSWLRSRTVGRCERHKRYN